MAIFSRSHVFPLPLLAGKFPPMKSYGIARAFFAVTWVNLVSAKKELISVITAAVFHSPSESSSLVRTRTCLFHTHSPFLGFLFLFFVIKVWLHAIANSSCQPHIDLSSLWETASWRTVTSCCLSPSDLMILISPFLRLSCLLLPFLRSLCPVFAIFASQSALRRP